MSERPHEALNTNAGQPSGSEVTAQAPVVQQTVFSAQSPPHPEPRFFEDGTQLSPGQLAYLVAYERGEFSQHEPIDQRLENIMEDIAARNQPGNKGST